MLNKDIVLMELKKKVSNVELDCETILEKDEIKNQFCLSHNYPLVRIPYTKLNNITIDDLLGDQYLVKGDDFSDTH